ncbi:MAG: DUF1015 domain-containing protein [Candidatus Nanopelagicales bacterium]
MSRKETKAPTGLTLLPFRATRYAGVDLAAVTSPPYDVVEPDRTLHLEAANPYNVVRLILPRETAATYPDKPAEDQAYTPCDRYEEAAKTWQTWLTSEILRTDDVSALWVYEQTGPAGVLVGVVGTVPVDQPAAVLPHEDVMADPVADRAELMDAVGANLEPILLVHDPAPHLLAADQISATTRIVDKVRQSPPAFTVATDDGATHRLWSITEPSTQQLINNDVQSRSALIADGHHRFAAYQRIAAQRHISRQPSSGDASTGAATGSAGQPWDRGLALLVDGHAHPLRLGAIHRVVHGLSWDKAVAELGRGIRQQPIESIDAAQLWLREAGTQPAASRLVLTDATRWMGLVIGDGSSMVPRPDRSPQWRSLPTAVLHELLLPHRWRISDDAVTYHHDVAGALRSASPDAVAVLLPPLPLSTVIERAAAGELLPRKSTSFGPKPRTGFLMRTFDDPATDG